MVAKVVPVKKSTSAAAEKLRQTVNAVSSKKATKSLLWLMIVMQTVQRVL
jgi:hypothetical protein